MARYRIVEMQPHVYHIEQKKFLRGWVYRGNAYSMNEADERLNAIRANELLSFPRVVREVRD